MGKYSDNIEKFRESLPIWNEGYSKTIPPDSGVRSPVDDRDILAITPNDIIVRSRSGGFAYPVELNYFDKVNK